MKYIYYFFFSLVLIMLTTIIVIAKGDKFILAGKTIIIDPGHGGKDVGTLYQDIYEKDINLAISLKLKESLNKKGASVLLIRDEDYDLSSPAADRRKKSDFDNRILYINDSHADYYFSIHINYLTDHSYSGAQVFYLDKDKELADKIQDSFNKNLSSSRKAKKMSNTYYMYKQLKVPGVLVECGFLSNSLERQKLLNEEYQTKIAEAISDGLIEYLNN